jgi:hypothetical protein
LALKADDILKTISTPRWFHHWRERNREVGLSVILGLLVITMFVVSPMARTGLLSAEVSEAMRFGLAAIAILVVNRIRFISIFVGVTFIVSLLCTIYLRTGTGSHTTLLANICFTIAFELGVVWLVAHAAFDAGRITIHRIMGAVILYLYIGLVFAGIYRLMMELLYPSFTGLSTIRGTISGELLYFSLSTLTTSGFGDIIPIHSFVRSLANLESVIGQLYPATFLARLVTLHGSDIEQ